MPKNDQEILHTVEVYKNKGEIFLRYLVDLEVKEENIRLSELVAQQVNEYLLACPPRGCKLIIDLSRLGGKGTTPSQTRKNYAQLAQDKRIQKAAIIGGNLKLKTIANFIMVMSGKKDKYKWFDSMEEAEKWINR